MCQHLKQQIKICANIYIHKFNNILNNYCYQVTPSKQLSMNATEDLQTIFSKRWKNVGRIF